MGNQLWRGHGIDQHPIRALRRLSGAPIDPVRVVGVDEWAKRQGQTILVDPGRHRIVDPPGRRPSVARVPAVCARLRTDLSAVTAAIREPWSQGLVEGFNCKIKRTKRLMYGRGRLTSCATRNSPPALSAAPLPRVRHVLLAKYPTTLSWLKSYARRH